MSSDLPLPGRAGFAFAIELHEGPQVGLVAARCRAIIALEGGLLLRRLVFASGGEVRIECVAEVPGAAAPIGEIRETREIPSTAMAGGNGPEVLICTES